MFKQLEVDWGNKDSFWKKTEEERYEYFRNASVQFLKIINIRKKIEKGGMLSEDDTKVALDFSNVIFFLVYLMTTDEEQNKEIEKVWLERIKKDLESDIFINYDLEGVA